MNTYLLLMRGDQTEFGKMNPEDQKKMIQAHIDYSRHLEALGVLVDGDGLAGNSLLLSETAVGSEVSVVDSPYLGTEAQLSGYYLIKAESQDSAVALAKGCPALRHGETIEIIALGH